MIYTILCFEFMQSNFIAFEMQVIRAEFRDQFGSNTAEERIIKNKVHFYSNQTFLGSYDLD